ncbi:MAG: DUF1802 family protein [Acidobacteria bacterium]|nr:DUF1802 family protein [Acidobacteriota bacterium]
MALKEWAVVVWAIAQGSQILLLRKGGIAEDEGEFRLAASEFFLYPTYEHQQESFLKPQYAEVFRSLTEKVPSQRELSFQHYVAVSDILPAPGLERMKLLRDALVWNDLFLEKRYGYKPQSPLFVLLVRAYSLPQPVEIPQQERYAGCRSWVELEESLSTEGAQPVLSDEEFEERRQDLRRQMAGPAFGAVRAG